MEKNVWLEKLYVEAHKESYNIYPPTLWLTRIRFTQISLSQLFKKFQFPEPKVELTKELVYFETQNNFKYKN